MTTDMARTPRIGYGLSARIRARRAALAAVVFVAWSVLPLPDGKSL